MPAVFRKPDPPRLKKIKHQMWFESITLDPEPDAELAEYTPYLYLAVSRYETGHTREARDALIQSQVYGVAP